MAGDDIFVNFIGTIIDAGTPFMTIPEGKWRVFGNAQAAMHLDGTIDDFV